MKRQTTITLFYTVVAIVSLAILALAFFLRSKLPKPDINTIVNAGKILEGEASLEEVGNEIYAKILEVAAGAQTASEALGHQECSIVYKSFEPTGPACMPA